MSSSVKYVCQCVSRAALAPGSWSNVYWSTAEEKEPLKRSPSIQDSRTSQPPRFTPRRNGIDVLPVEVDVVDGEEVVELDLAALLLVVGVSEVDEIDGGIIEVVSVEREIDGIEVEIDGIETGIDGARTEVEGVVAETVDVELVGSAKEPVVWIVKKGIEEVALARVPFAIDPVLAGEVLFRVPLP